MTEKREVLVRALELRSGVRLRYLVVLLCFVGFTTSVAQADISGWVVDDADNSPIADALVSVRARPDISPVATASDGSYHLPLPEMDGIFELGVARPWNPETGFNYLVGTVQAFNGL